MNPSGPKPALRDFEPAALAEQKIAGGHAHVFQKHFGVACGASS